MPDAAANVVPYLVLGLGIAALAMGLMQLAGDLRRRENKRIAARLTSYASGETRPTHLLRDLDSASRSLIGRLLSADERGRALQRLLRQADVPWPAHQFVSGVLLLMCFVVLLFSGLNAWAGTQISGVLIGLATAMAGLLPFGVFAFMRARRRNKFLKQLPDVFELLGQALRAGHALISGIQLVGEQLPDPVGREFRRAFQEQNFGIKLEDALVNMADRVGLLEVRMFVTSVLIQRQTGGDLAEVLDKSSELIRDRLKLAGTVKALTAEGRMSGWVLTGLPILVGFYAWRINPAYMDELFHGDAQILLKVAVVLHISGFLMIQKIIRIKY